MAVNVFLHMQLPDEVTQRSKDAEQIEPQGGIPQATYTLPALALMPGLIHQELHWNLPPHTYSCLHLPRDSKAILRWPPTSILRNTRNLSYAARNEYLLILANFRLVLLLRYSALFLYIFYII